MELAVADISKAVAELRKASGNGPSYAQVSLGSLRAACVDVLTGTPIKYEGELDQWKDLPDEAILVFQTGKPTTVLVDDEGRLLRFR